MRNGLRLCLAAAGDGCALWQTVEPTRLLLSQWFEWPKRITSAESGEDYLREIRDGASGRLRLLWLIRDGDVPIGGVQLRLRDGGRGASLPYWVIPSRQRKGVATWAVNALAEPLALMGFWFLDFHIDATNIASQRVAEKCGLRYVGNIASTFRVAEVVNRRYMRQLCELPLVMGFGYE